MTPKRTQVGRRATWRHDSAEQFAEQETRRLLWLDAKAVEKAARTMVVHG